MRACCSSRVELECQTAVVGTDIGYRAQSTNPLPYPLILANCVAWVSYAYVKQDIFVFLANESGIIFGLFFTLSAYGVANTKVSPSGSLWDQWELLCGSAAYTLLISIC